MAHKGYTLNYFIDFFKSIPDHRWTTDTLQKEGTGQFCAIGHCLANQNSNPKNVDLTNGAYSSAKAEALEQLLGWDVPDINDGNGKYKKLGKTPRGRILRALRNRKRTETFWVKNLKQ